MVAVQQLEPATPGTASRLDVLGEVYPVLGVSVFLDPHLDRHRVDLQAGRVHDAGGSALAVEGNRASGHGSRLPERVNADVVTVVGIA